MSAGGGTGRRPDVKPPENPSSNLGPRTTDQTPELRRLLEAVVAENRDGFSVRGAGEASWFVHKHGAEMLSLLDELEGRNRLLARALPLIQHSEREGCPMAFHRSNGQQCTCGAIDVAREIRAALAKEERHGR